MKSGQTSYVPLLELKDISKSFGGMPVLKNISLCINKGEVHTLMGENGAGKSTLMKIIAGIHSASSGSMQLKGVPVNFSFPAEALRSGITMIHQELNSIPDMSVADNLFLGREPLIFLGIINRKALMNQTRAMLSRFGLTIHPATLMRDLSLADLQMMEIIKAVSYEAEVIIMDEPTSALSSKEVNKLFNVIRELKEKGVAILYISHRMEEVFGISDRITVLRDGALISSRPALSFNNDSLIREMVGREISEIFPSPAAFSNEEVLSVAHLSRRGKYTDISFNLHKGEIVGIAGLMGAGRTEVVEAIFGMDPPDCGDIFINKIKTTIRSPAEAIAKGMAFVPEDRKLKGLSLTASVSDNISLVNLKKYCWMNQVINAKKEKSAVDEMVRMLQIKIQHANIAVGHLSGGNQQKCVMAKWLIGNFDILLLDEPTRGIDIGAKTGIYQLICDIAAQGKAIILVSSEILELLGVCHRILVMSEGRITASFGREEFSQEKIMEKAMPAA